MCASGLALAVSFPSLNLDLLAWAAFVPLLYVVEDEPYGRVFLYAWLQGSVFGLMSLGWLVHFIDDLGGTGSIAAGLCLLSLAVVLAVYGAVAIVAGVRLSRSLGFALFLKIGRIAAIPILGGRRLLWALAEADARFDRVEGNLAIGDRVDYFMRARGR